MSRPKSFFILCFLLLLFYSCGNSETSPATEKHEPGQSLYLTNCTSCHGEDGRLCVLGAKDLTISTFSKEEAMEIITNGKSTMTPFGSMLKPEEISAIADYIQTLKK